MPIVENELALLRQPRIAALATSVRPAWLWSIDGRQIVWANAIGAAIFGAATTEQCRAHRRETGDAVAAQIVRLAATLPAMAQSRLERLRGFGANFGRALTCLCSRIVLDDGKAAVLVAAAEPAGPNLPLDERVRRLFGDRDEPIAAFAADGGLVYANAAARKELGGADRLSALGIDTLAAAALQSGQGTATAQWNGKSLAVTATRLGGDASQLLVLTMPQQAEAPAAAQEAHETNAADANAAAAPEAPASPMPPPAAEQDHQHADATPKTESPFAHDAMAERRHPLRFVWQMDADGRFGVGSDEFIELAGPHTAAAFGRPWHEIADELKLDPNNQVTRAVASRETWSGITILWPVDDSAERLPIEMSGLPVFDRDRGFRGYRGFGVCRDIDRLNHLARVRREHASGPTPAMSAQAPRLAAAAPPPPDAPPIEPAAASPAPAPPAAERPAPATPAPANVVPFRPSSPADSKTPPTLSPVERRAFRELAQELTARLRGPEAPAAETGAEEAPAAPVEAATAPAAEPIIEQLLLDRIPVGVLVYRHDKVLYANRHFLDWSGYESLAAIETAGGLSTLFAEPGADALAPSEATAMLASLSIVTQRGETVPVQGRMFTVPWRGAPALALILTNGQAAAAQQETERALSAAKQEVRALKSALDCATDGVTILDAQGRIVTANPHAARLFGKAAAELAGLSFGDVLAPESEAAARASFDRLARGAGSESDGALEVSGRGAGERLLPLTMALGRIDGDRFCAVFHDITGRKQSEDELRDAKRETLRAASAKAEFLARVSHEIRTPLNAMIGFAEVIMAERLGPIGNERYRDYIKDIHGAGTHLVSMLNDLFDLSRVETGQIELNFASVALNELTQQCVGIMQPQANRARIIIRTALTPALPAIVADERSLRQIVLNLIANSIRFTGPGGQVIVSTLMTDSREVVLRVRDTGAGMSEKDIEAALEPFRQTAISGSWGSGGSGLGLPLTKALAEANHANFSIKSAPNAGTLIEIAFPPHRLAQG